MLRRPTLLLPALLLLTAVAGADTRSGLMLRPMPEDRAAQLEFEINQYAEAKTDAGFDVDMRFFATKGRVKVAPKAGRKSPLFGFELLPALSSMSAQRPVPPGVPSVQ